jgi:hypothetical protein
MRHVTVDPTARRARFEGGCLVGTIDTATQNYGLAFPAGVVSHSGSTADARSTSGTLAPTSTRISTSLQRLANSLQAFAEYFGVHSHADAEMVGQAEKPAGHG